MLWRGRDARLHSRRLLGDSPTRQSDLLTIVQEIGSVPKIDHQGSIFARRDCAKGLGPIGFRHAPRHRTTFEESDLIARSDWPGPLAKRALRVVSTTMMVASPRWPRSVRASSLLSSFAADHLVRDRYAISSH